MKIVITGSLGHISKPLTEELEYKGHDITVISSKPEKQKAIEALGATAAIGSLEDVDFLKHTFTGADAVYTMVPPNDFFDHKLDLSAFIHKIGKNYVQAIQSAGIKRVVHLSSIGAHLDKGTGIILDHREVENILSTNLPDGSITFMRPTSFFYNLYAFLHVIKNTDVIASNYGDDDKVSWVSPLDIATAIADEIVTPLVGTKVRYVASEEQTCNEVASILGKAIGKPDLKWITITNAQMQSNLETIGMNPNIAAGLVEMQHSIHTGEFFHDYYQNRPQVMGKEKLKDFALEFAGVYKQI